MTATYMRPCDSCGVDVETGGDYPRSRPRFCTSCGKEREKAKNREFMRRYNAGKKSEIKREPIHVLDISPTVTDSEWRWYLSGYKNNTLPWRYFRESLEDGAFDGLVIERGGQRYEVVCGKLVQPGDYRQAALLEAHP